MQSLVQFLMTGLGLSREQMRFLIRSGWITLVSIHMLWVCGWLTYFGAAVPFARAETSEQVQRELTQDRIERIDSMILNVRVAQCRSEPNSPARAQYGERLQELINRYIWIAKANPRVPGCDEV